MFVIKNIVNHGWIFNNPSVGLPEISSIYSLNDHPQYSEFINLILVKFLNLFTDNIFLISNIFLLSSFFLVSLCCFIALRAYGISAFTSIIIGILYAFLPYHFERNAWHLFLSNYSIIPLTSIIFLWIYEEKIKMLDYNKNKQICLNINKYFILSSFIVILASLSGFYYSCYTILFLGFSLGLFSLRKGSLFNQNLIIFLFFLLLILLLTFYINLPTILDLIKSNYENYFSERYYNSSYTLGLKIINLFLPIENHYFNNFDNLKIFFNDVIDIEQENRAASLGILVVSGFLFSLLWLLLRNNNIESLYTKTVKKFFLKDKDCEKISFLASMNLLSILFFCGGGGLIMFVLVLFPALRSNARCIVFIAFFSLTIIAIIFDKIIAHKFFKSTFNAKIFIIFISFLALLDQVGRTSSSKLQSLKIVETFYNDKDFIEQIEKSLVVNSAIFILPIYSFPESNGDDYQGLVAYLHSKNLRFSYPVNRIGKSFTWQKQSFMNLSFKNFIKELKNKGFAGIYLDRYEYITFFNNKRRRVIDRNTLENEMKKYSISPPIYSRDGNLMFIRI